MNKYWQGIIIAIIGAAGAISVALINSTGKEEPKQPAQPSIQVKQDNNSSIQNSFNTVTQKYENNFSDINNSSIQLSQGNVYNGAKAK